MGTMTSAERQAVFRERMRAEGKRSVTGIVHDHQLSDLLILMRRLRDNPDLVVGNLRCRRTGKVVKL